MKIIEDLNNKPGQHELKNNYFESQGIEVERLRLPVGDYVLVDDKVEDVLKRKADRGIKVKQMDLLGSYKLCVDTKFGIEELCGNICGKQHERFRDECILAQNNGIKLVVLVEDDGGYCDKKEIVYNKPVRSIEDLFGWRNPRLFIFKKGRQAYPNAVRGRTLARCLITMHHKYNVDFEFCGSKEAGAKVIEILENADGRN